MHVFVLLAVWGLEDICPPKLAHSRGLWGLTIGELIRHLLFQGGSPIYYPILDIVPYTFRIFPLGPQVIAKLTYNLVKVREEIYVSSSWRFSQHSNINQTSLGLFPWGVSSCSC